MLRRLKGRLQSFLDQEYLGGLAVASRVTPADLAIGLIDRLLMGEQVLPGSEWMGNL